MLLNHGSYIIIIIILLLLYYSYSSYYSYYSYYSYSFLFLLPPLFGLCREHPDQGSPVYNLGHLVNLGLLDNHLFT